MSVKNSSTPLLSVQHLTCEYRTGGGQVLQAVADISFEVFEGETLALVGESGCGKSTTGKCIIGLEPARAGKVLFKGLDLLAPRVLRQQRQQLQMVFQDPISSLNPRRRCGDIVAEPLRIRGQLSAAEIREKASHALETVGFDADAVWNRKPHQFSGGQCQRISLARAIVSEPAFLICDEPVSALDVSVQSQILNLLEDMKAQYSLTMIFISHDLAVVKQISDRVAVMYLGKLCEVAPVEDFYRNPRHPYSAALLDCVPRMDRPADYSLSEDEAGLKGEIPSPLQPPSGCRFRTRCPKAREECAATEPLLREVNADHWLACHFPL